MIVYNAFGNESEKYKLDKNDKRFLFAKSSYDGSFITESLEYETDEAHPEGKRVVKKTLYNARGLASDFSVNTFGIVSEDGEVTVIDGMLDVKVINGAPVSVIKVGSQEGRHHYNEFDGKSLAYTELGGLVNPASKTSIYYAKGGLVTHVLADGRLTIENQIKNGYLMKQLKYDYTALNILSRKLPTPNVTEFNAYGEPTQLMYYENSYNWWRKKPITVEKYSWESDGSHRIDSYRKGQYRESGYFNELGSFERREFPESENRKRVVAPIKKDGQYILQVRSTLTENDKETVLEETTSKTIVKDGVIKNVVDVEDKIAFEKGFVVSGLFVTTAALLLFAFLIGTGAIAAGAVSIVGVILYSSAAGLVAGLLGGIMYIMPFNWGSLFFIKFGYIGVAARHVIDLAFSFKAVAAAVTPVLLAISALAGIVRHKRKVVKGAKRFDIKKIEGSEATPVSGMVKETEIDELISSFMDDEYRREAVEWSVEHISSGPKKTKLTMYWLARRLFRFKLYKQALDEFKRYGFAEESYSTLVMHKRFMTMRFNIDRRYFANKVISQFGLEAIKDHVKSLKKQKRRLSKDYDRKDLQSFESNARTIREIDEKIKKLEGFIYQLELAVQDRISQHVYALLDSIPQSTEISGQIISKTARNLEEAEETIKRLETDIAELQKGEVLKLKKAYDSNDDELIKIIDAHVKSAVEKMKDDDKNKLAGALKNIGVDVDSSNFIEKANVRELLRAYKDDGKTIAGILGILKSFGIPLDEIQNIGRIIDLRKQEAARKNEVNFFGGASFNKHEINAAKFAEGFNTLSPEIHKILSENGITAENAGNQTPEQIAEVLTAMLGAGRNTLS